MQLDRIVAGFCGVTLVAGLGAVGVVAAPAGEVAPPPAQTLAVDPDPSTVGQTVTISNEDEDGRCPAGDFFPASEHEESQFYVELIIEPPTGEPTTVHAATEPGEDWEVEYTSAEVGVHEVTGACFDRFGFQIRTTEWAAGPDLVAAPAGVAESPEALHAYEGSFTVEAEDETTTTTTPTTTTTTVATTTTTGVAPGPDAGADTQTPPATPARATPTFVG